MPPLLQIQNAHKRYADNVLLDGADLTINDDAKIGLIGRNGAGKSTLARVLLGSLQPNTRASSLTKGDGGMEFAVIDGIVSAQGPNYALSKRLQAWRAMPARANGQVSRIQLLFVSLPLFCVYD